MSSKLTLYDLPHRNLRAWSPNVWKTRLILNYKNIPYSTKWLTHPEITPTLQGLGLAPNAPSATGPTSPYSLPAIQLADGTAVMESSIIAAKLEELYPEPALHPDNGLPEKIGAFIGKLSFPLIPVFMPRIGRDVVVEETVPFFQETRAKRFGMPLDELEKVRGGEPAWEAAKPGFVELNAFIASQRRDQGPFILGKEVCYADFVVAALVESLKRIGEDMYEKLREVSGEDGILEVHRACQKWFANDQ